ncbi:angiogenic factor with G patch and FHA domains 1 isoform X1 [Manduca sexta]|uniref:angiogenic factor with G patch and FHA domains 1 isoform X1 n=1 Tax=Manduca sexta TaxID=7130 RepID=UPI00189003BD|nr:angiogenic factor with G patch and FHA domains 1 isoform X1 [Manduca sexta]
MKKINMRNLRISLKYRPEVLKLIFKMRLCIHRKNTMIKKLKTDLKGMKVTHNKENVAKDEICIDNHSSAKLVDNQTSIKNTTDSSTQTENLAEVKDSAEPKKESNNVEIKTDSEKTGWDLKNDSGEKSIAEQVKEVAQSALQQTGMVYVESAGMYYDYKTGYYYNSELGLYYHTDTGCYYYYSDEKQSFVFHSYPDRSAENPALAAHEKKKAKKHKKEQKKEVDIDNLTKNMSQGEDEKPSKPKRKKVLKKKIAKKPKTNVENIENNDQAEETDRELNKTKETSDSKIEESNEKGLDEDKEKNVVDPELEDGECSETESEASSDETNKSKASTSTDSDDESVAKHHPPSMRVIVRETNLTKLKVGNLFLITKDGGTIGREGDQHVIIINDHAVSRNHLDIKYDMARGTYLATDLGSKNGTVLNGIRMSESQDISVPMEVMHGSTIQLGETKLLCHIHPGNDTCGHCEPGLIMETQEKQKVAYTRTCNVQKQHQLELARLKNKYAPKQLSIDSVAYNDRAQARRHAVGSSHHAEKTHSSDLDTFIPAENKGFKLLEKMGWSKGEGLGKDNQGDTEPIPLVSNEGTSGLGSSGGGAPKPLPMNRVTNTLGPATLRLASKTKMLNKPAKAFQDQLDDEELE